MTLSAALQYAATRWSVFPCHAAGERRKRPHVKGGFHAATRDLDQITAWWERWPDALIGLPTGRITGLVVLDIDVKDDRSNGYDALEDLGRSILPNTWLAHTASGGLHVYFDPQGREVHNSASQLGRGLDVRGDGGYVIAPGSCGYSWDPHCNPTTIALVRVPVWLIPPEPERLRPPAEPADGLSPYARAALNNACRNIATAPAGEQERTLTAEAFSIGRLAGAGAIPTRFACQALVYAGEQMVSHDPRRRWVTREIAEKVERSFRNGVGQPRDTRRHA